MHRTSSRSTPDIGDKALDDAPAHTSGMKVSVLIPVRDDAAGLRTTLASIRDAAWDDSVDVIVCDDGGPPEISRIAAEYGFRSVRLDEPGGSYAARNLGIRNSDSNFIAFMDADETVVGDWLKTGLAALADSEYVGGRINVVPSNPLSFWQRVDSRYAFPVEAYVGELHFAPTANLFVRRHVFERVGLFEQALQSGGDREFGQRVHRAGIAQRYCPDAVLGHPARNLRQQLGKLRRVAKGSFAIERSSARSSWPTLARSAARAVRSAIHSIGHLPAATAGSQTDALALAKCLLDGYFHWRVMLQAGSDLLRPRSRVTPQPTRRA